MILHLGRCGNPFPFCEFRSCSHRALFNSDRCIIRTLIPYDTCREDILLRSLKDSASKGLLGEAFKTFSEIQHCAVSPCPTIVSSISSLLESCFDVGFTRQGEQLHSHAIRRGFEKLPVLVKNLVNFYTSVDLITVAHTLIRESDVAYNLPWNLLISAYVKNDFNREAISSYTEMMSLGVSPDFYTYPSVLKACGKEKDLVMGKKIHESIVDNAAFISPSWSIVVHNALLSMYSKCGELDTARNLFDKMPERDSISWNTMISGYASSRKWGVAFRLFEDMRLSGVKIDGTTWNAIANAYLRTSNFEEALETVSRMKRLGADVDSITLLSGLTACSHTRALRQGREIHGSSIRACYDGFENVRNALITMYSRCDDLGLARSLFETAGVRTVVTWNSMISGYASSDRWEEARMVFVEMMRSGVSPNYVTVASMIYSCSRAGDLEQGMELHCYVTRRGEEFEGLPLLWNALIDMYGRSGKVLNARRVFDSLAIEGRDECTYTCMISAYGMQGEGESGLSLFRDMVRRKVRPDHVTLVAVLSGCSHSGLVNEAGDLFRNLMDGAYDGVVPRLEHFSCMVDMYGRSGMVSRAVRMMVMEMPYEPTPAMWAAVVSACCTHRLFDVGEWAAERLLKSRPMHSGYYALVGNLYASAGLWSELSLARNRMKELGVNKCPGSSSVCVRHHGFQSFVAWDSLSPHFRFLCPLLLGLNELMKDSHGGVHHSSTNAC